MKITATKLTDEKLMQRACEATTHGQKSKMTLFRIYRCEHSPIRTQMFKIEMEGIPTFVSVHFTRHSIGVTHFVTSNRVDRGGNGEETRNTLVNHTMLINAEALINISKKRLCTQSSKETQATMTGIRDAISLVDSALAGRMVASCVYRNGCYEDKCCGLSKAME